MVWRNFIAPTVDRKHIDVAIATVKDAAWWSKACLYVLFNLKTGEQLRREFVREVSVVSTSHSSFLLLFPIVAGLSSIMMLVSCCTWLSYCYYAFFLLHRHYCHAELLLYHNINRVNKYKIIHTKKHYLLLLIICCAA